MLHSTRYAQLNRASLRSVSMYFFLLKSLFLRKNSTLTEAGFERIQKRILVAMFAVLFHVLTQRTSSLKRNTHLANI